MAIKLETQRLVLRKPRMSDYKDIYEGINNYEVVKYLLVVPYPYSKEDAKEFIKRCTEKWKEKEKKTYKFFIELKEEAKVIGVIDLHNVNKVQGTAETGSWLNENYHRKGYMTEAKIAVNEFAFNELGLRRLETSTFEVNKASKKTQLRMGYQIEGFHKEYAVCKANGKIHNGYSFGLLKRDWKKNLPKVRRHLREKIKHLEKKSSKKKRRRIFS